MRKDNLFNQTMVLFLGCFPCVVSLEWIWIISSALPVLSVTRIYIPLLYLFTSISTCSPLRLHPGITAPVVRLYNVCFCTSPITYA